MDQGTLVGPHVDDGRRLIERLIADGVPVLAAAWLKPSEEGSWVLYIVTPLVDDRGLHDAYLQVHGALSRIESAGLTTANIRFVGTRDPLAEVLESILQQRPKSRGISWAGPRLADIQVDDAYIYPRPTSPLVGGPAMTTDEVLGDCWP